MTDIPDNPPAFPVPDMEREVWQTGMTLRDWFAGQALAGLLSQPDFDSHHDDAEDMARDLYEMADAMLAEREKRNG